MFLRKCRQRKNGQDYAYWQLVESYRTQSGPRQRIVAHLGDMDECGRLGVPVGKVNDDRLYRALDVVLPTKSGVKIRRRCIAQPTKRKSSETMITAPIYPSP